MTHKQASDWLITAAINYRDGYRIREDEKLSVAQAIHAVTTGQFETPEITNKQEYANTAETDTNA